MAQLVYDRILNFRVRPNTEYSANLPNPSAEYLVCVGLKMAKNESRKIGRPSERYVSGICWLKRSFGTSGRYVSGMCWSKNG